MKKLQTDYIRKAYVLGKNDGTEKEFDELCQEYEKQLSRKRK